jgi:4a-hydroxytetrahydrobiopterin dehydratase
MSTFTDDEITAALEDLPGWSADGDAITKTYEFADFRAALDFMNRAAGPIEEMDHHPEWTNVYNRVEVRLSSHDVGGVTNRDTRLATVLERVADAT